MTIGEAARRSGVSAKAIRYYESIGLIAASRRGDNGYRAFDDTGVHILRFIARALRLGFTVDEVGRLLALYGDRARSSADVRAVASAAVARIDGKVAELHGMRATLSHLIARCHGDARPECPILDDLAALGDDEAVAHE